MTRAALMAAVCALLAQAVFRSGTDAVNVDVSVRDGTKVVNGLRAADFELLDNGVPQDVADVSFDRLPIDVTLVLDVSFSVTGSLLDRLRAATRQLVNDLTKDDRLALVDFNMRIHRAVDFTNDPGAIDRALAAVTAGGGSSIRDALAVALVSASEPQRRQLIVVFTDGADSTSFTTPPALLDLAKRTNASVAAVIPGSGVAAGPQTRQGRELMRGLAEQTGGTVIDVPLAGTAWRIVDGTRRITMNPGVDLTATFRKVVGDFRQSYVLRFTPKGVAPGGYHALEVKVKNRRGVTVRARPGYQR